MNLKIEKLKMYRGSLEGGRGIPIKKTALAISPAKSIPSLTLPRQIQNKLAPLLVFALSKYESTTSFKRAGFLI